MEQFIQSYPNLVISFIGLLISYFLWSSNRTLARIDQTLTKHQKLLFDLIQDFSQLKGEHIALTQRGGIHSGK